MPVGGNRASMRRRVRDCRANEDYIERASRADRATSPEGKRTQFGSVCYHALTAYSNRTGYKVLCCTKKGPSIDEALKKKAEEPKRMDDPSAPGSPAEKCRATSSATP